MEIERKTSHGKESLVRHWNNGEIKELHKSKGYAWRSVHTNIESLKPTSPRYAKRYKEIFGHK